MRKLYLVSIVFLIIVLSIFYIFLTRKTENKEPEKAKNNTVETPTREKEMLEPISNAKTRITKKPYGLFVTPFNSPVHPEKFTGFHTGVDFESTPEETDSDVLVNAICNGKIREKTIISGYGGVIIQDCLIQNQAVTVLYGHITYSQSNLNIGDNVNKGQKLASLAPAYSDLSGGERKHLHLGIHKGLTIEYRGYVSDKSELQNWLNAELLL